MKGIAALLLSATLFVGCTFVPIQYSESDKIVRDPSYLRVVVINTSGYYLEVEGEIKGELGPNESATIHLGCPGTHRILAHAYKEIGRSANGKYVEKIFVGDQDINFHVKPTDSYNYNGMVVAARVHLGSFYLNPRYPYPKEHVLNYSPCNIFAPNLSIEKR